MASNLSAQRPPACRCTAPGSVDPSDSAASTCLAWRRRFHLPQAHPPRA